MKRTYDIIIIGAGCLGASVFYFLKKKGIKNILVIDKNSIGSGVSSKSGGMFRSFHLSEKDTNAAFYSKTVFKELHDEINLNISITGAINIVHNSILNNFMKENFYFLSQNDFHEKFPHIKIQKNETAIYESYAGSISPQEYCQKIINHKKDTTDQILENTSVYKVVKNNRLNHHEVLTDNGSFFTENIVITANLSSFDILSDHLDKSQVEQRTINTFEITNISSKKLPNFFDYKNIFYGSSRYANSNKTVFGVHSKEKADTQIIENFMRQRFKNNFEIKKKISAEDIYINNKGISGEVCGHKGLYILTGWGGGAFKFSPYLGCILSSQIHNNILNKRNYNHGYRL